MSKENVFEQGNSMPTPHSIIQQITDFDDPENFRDNLRVLMDSFFLYFPEPTESFKQEIHVTYENLDRALKSICKLNNVKNEQAD